jgi:hypothetical protein
MVIRPAAPLVRDEEATVPAGYRWEKRPWTVTVAHDQPSDGCPVGDSSHMSTPLAQQLPVLIGVAIGSVATYVTTSLGDRTRWRRGRDERWDAARMQAYSEFGNAVKEVFHLATRIAKGRGMPYSAEPLNPDMEAISALNDAESKRARAWESVLLLGDPRECGGWA